MEDLSLRADFHRALDVLAPPAPWLSASVRERLREQRRSERTRRVPPTALRAPWLLPLVAVLLALAIVAALLYGERVLNLKPAPVHPPGQGQAPAGCPPWGTSSSGGFVPASDKMTSASTGWSSGALRTTDGGARWQDVSPAALHADAPGGTGARSYPPGYTDFFLDSNHAWMARGVNSTTSCFSHETVFATSDGGATWIQSAPIDAPVTADSSLQLLLDFIDPQHGWLMVLGMGRLAPDWFVYSTTDAGHSWQLVSQLPLISSPCAVRFVSATTGFLGNCLNTGGPTASLTVTRDGGKTWAPVRLPEPFGSQFTVDTPVFFNQDRGIVTVIAQTTQGNTMTSNEYLAETSDGGQTWKALPPLPAGLGVAFDFVDPNDFWTYGADSKSGATSIYRTTDGGLTWTVVKSDLPSMDFGTIHFVDAQHGFIMASNQSIGLGPSGLLVTGDGGVTWTQIHPVIS